MSVKPILMNTEMVRAILDGRKTVTRRAVKCTHKNAAGFDIVRNHDGKIVGVLDYDEDERSFDNYTVPPYKPGDILWVRETWNRGYIDSSDAELCNESWFEEYHKRDGSFLDGISGYVYRADFTRAEEYELGTLDEDNTPRPMPWRPSIHMPREAARIWLRVTDVRVERLGAISYEDLQREGGKSDFYKVKRCRACGYGEPHYPECDYEHCDNYERLWEESFLPPFMKLWDSTIKHADLDRYGWDANPWVWVIAFERCEMPEEA